MIAGFGQTSLAPFVRSNRHLSSSRTCGDLFQVEDSNPFWLTLPTSGSMRAGVCCQLPPLVLPTSASVSSSSLTEWATPVSSDSRRGSASEAFAERSLIREAMTWPTPQANDDNRDRASQEQKERWSQRERASRELAIDVALWKTPHGFQAGNGPDGNEFSKSIRAWATPRAEDSESSGERVERGVADTLTAQTKLWATPLAGRRGAEDPEKKAARQHLNGGGTSDLLIQAQQWPKQMWPTPDASLLNDGQTEEARAKRKERELAKKYNGNGGGEPLAYYARVWPTPTAMDSEQAGADVASRGPSLNLSAKVWPTPANRDYRSPNTETYAERGGGKKGEQLPNFVRFLCLPQDRPTSDGQESSESTPTPRRRLNPVFVCWLMGWPLWWTRAEPTSFGAAETASWRSRLQLHLYFLLGGR